jgi:CRP-like cAMP-binding protein
MEPEATTCINAVPAEVLTGGARPWAPGNREDDVDIERAAQDPDEQVWCMAEVDIFCDLSDAEMDAMAEAAPMRTYERGELVYTPHQPLETLFILKKGRIRIFRVSPDGRALTTAIVEPGTIFGEMVIVGQQMHDSFAEALDSVVVCAMTSADVQRLLLGDARIAARISAILGRRVGELEQRLSDAIFKSVPERIAGALVTLAGKHSGRPLGRPLGRPQVRLTHEQLAALAGTSRETTTKVLNEYAAQGIVSLGRGRISILDPARMRALTGD